MLPFGHYRATFVAVMHIEKGNFQMSNIVRAWKDEAYRQGLSAEEQALLPANPAGEIELTEAELDAISGASGFPGFSGYPGGSGSPFNSDNVSSSANQIVTFEPVFGGSSITISGARCNNLFS